MELEKLVTETRNPNSMKIDRVSTLEMVKMINDEDQKVALAVKEVLPQIAEAIDQISPRFQAGGRIIYCGAGTSGRLGALDAIELKPTYSVEPERAFGLLAGGKKAMFEAVEGAEDSKELALADLKEYNLTAQDTVIAIAASGRTPYAIAALEYANQLGALSIAVTCNPDSEMDTVAAISIAPIVGPEVITGSTRMKAGTAQKLVLNTLSTGVMVKSGKVYQNLMINVQPTNLKLKDRAVRIVQEATGKETEKVINVLEQANYQVAIAIIMLETGLSLEESQAAWQEEANITKIIQKYRASN